MRSTPVRIAVALALLVALVGCSRNLAGTPRGDLAPPLVAITDDEFGIRAGLADAPIQLELFTEPQCSHCADLQKDFGDQFAYYLGTGQLAITYRPMTFLDGPATNGHSARVANAMFVAATPGGLAPNTSVTTARQFQHFVELLWAHQERGGPGPSDGELADLARQAHVPDFQVKAIETGANAKTAKDLADMESSNFEYLYEVDPLETGTPTVLDLNTGQKLDVYDNDWLAKVMAS
ncbi:DsbA family protein [Mycolicibacterium sp. 050158]|uniref:DsbA family protein n=1 Tax=Mycolicibacterium sp. 050158 TaxID=3090602 RepID=UPI00299D398B|nr:thioredoxin domain-containing protein [Mycolicibacterium sp. 050158]MDX1887967.1 thioredoxin domain-containing protein [Mycolicibacterium sp. 050158]